MDTKDSIKKDQIHSNIPEQYYQDDEISLKELFLKLHEWWRYLLSKWLLIAIAGIVGGASGILYSYSKKPLYKAELTFVLEEESGGSSLGGYASIAGQSGIDLGGSGGGGVFTGDNLMPLMKSRSMIEKALLTSIDINGTQETLAEFYIKINGLREDPSMKQLLTKAEFKPATDPSRFNLAQSTLMKSFYGSIISNSLKVDKFDKKSGIISVQVVSKDELFSKYFAEALTREVSDFYRETKTRKSAVNLAILQHQKDSVKRAFDYAISGVASSSDANPNPNAAMQLLRVPSQRKQFDVQANQAILTQLIQNLEIAKVSLRKETPLIQIIDRPVLPLEMEEFSKLNGLILGSFLAGFLMTIVLILRKFLQAVMA